MTERVANFSAGPAVIPEDVLNKTSSEMLSWNGCGMSVMELSHRGPEFTRIITEASDDLRKLLAIPANYRVLFLQGGGTQQFAAVLLNLATDKSKPVDYIISGSWSQKAADEATKLGYDLNVVATCKDNNFTNLPPESEFKYSAKEPSFVYYCSNETIHGLEISNTPNIPFESSKVPLVCDMSSNFLSKPVDVSKFGVIFAGAQKNLGPAGVTLVIVREDLLDRSKNVPIPSCLDWKLFASAESMYNTPPTWSIYVSGLVLKHILKTFGSLEKVEAHNLRKSELLYGALESFPQVYHCPVDKRYQSRMNVPFRILSKGKPDSKLEEEFCIEAERRKLVQLKGHRSVGGLRASLYNAMELSDVEKLVKLVNDCAKKQLNAS